MDNSSECISAGVSRDNINKKILITHCNDIDCRT